MNFPTVFKHGFMAMILSLIVLSSCNHKNKSNQTTDGTYIVSKNDTVIDANAITKRADDLIGANRMTDAAAFVSINLHRFSGSDRAILLNQRGTAYFLKDDMEKAVSDYLAASELEPENATYMLNVANAYESMDRFSNAAFFSKRVLELKSASDTDKMAAKTMIDRYESTHAGQ
jgi:tetratricopeptide (TPR) repeat protein